MKHKNIIHLIDSFENKTDLVLVTEFARVSAWCVTFERITRRHLVSLKLLCSSRASFFRFCKRRAVCLKM